MAESWFSDIRTTYGELDGRKLVFCNVSRRLKRYLTLQVRLARNRAVETHVMKVLISKKFGQMRSLRIIELRCSCRPKVVIVGQDRKPTFWPTRTAQYMICKLSALQEYLVVSVNFLSTKSIGRSTPKSQRFITVVPTSYLIIA